MGEALSALFSLLAFLVIIVGVVGIIRWIVRAPDRLRRPRRERDPPTEKQLGFLDDLMQEREVEAWMLEREPESVKEASDWIETLLAAPRRC